MKAVIFSAVAVLAVVGITLAQDFNNFNNFNNDDGFNNFNNDDDEGWGRGGSWALGGGRVGGVSSSWGSSWGGHSAGAGYGGMGYGYGAGAGYGSGLGKVSYIPLPVARKAKGSGIFETLLPLLLLFLILPNLLGSSQTSSVTMLSGDTSG